MANIEQTLMKIRDKIKPLLLEMYPGLSEAISFHWQEGYQEWFGMLFKLREWQLRPGMLDINDIITSDTKELEARGELESYEGLEDYGFISAVEMEDRFHLIDGYHRVLIARDNGMLQLKACIWKKEENLHENCDKIRKLIIDNL